MQISLSSLLLLAFHTTRTTLGGNGTDVGDHVVLGGSSEATPQTWFLDPSYMFESIQSISIPFSSQIQAYLPSALRASRAVHALVAPQPPSPDFWQMAKKSEKTLQVYVHHLLQSAATYFKSTKFTDITSAMNDIVIATATFRDGINGALDAHNVTFDMLSQELDGIFMAIVDGLEKVPSPDKAPGHAERAEMVDEILDDTTRELMKLATKYGIEKEVVTYLFDLKPQVQALIVTVGDINEQYPGLLPTLAFSVAVLLIPESWILRPFLSLFGFGPTGPLKGSTAAWLQSRFWGGAVEPGSWFSWLQAAGMGVMPKWAGIVIKVPLLVGGLLAGWLPCSCFNRR